MIVAAPVRVGNVGSAVYGLSTGFRIGAGKVGKGGTTGNAKVGERNGLTGAQNGNGGINWAEQGVAEPRIKVNKQIPNKINTEIFKILIFITIYPL